MQKRVYQFDETKPKSKRTVVSSREYRQLRAKQIRWMARIRRAMTALSKIDRQMKRLGM